MKDNLFNYSDFSSDISKENQQLLKQYEPVFKLLYNWAEEWHLYDLLTFHDTQFYKLEEMHYLKEYWDVDLSEHFKDKFIAFAYDGGGGNFCFWFYPGLLGEPPIIFNDGHGEQYMLASNLNDFVNRMINELEFCGGWWDNSWLSEGYSIQEKFKEMLCELVDSYTEEHQGKQITEEEAEKLFLKDRQFFKEKASKVITFKNSEDIKKDFKKHPIFSDWNKKVEQKNDELYQVSKIEINPKELIESYNNAIKNNIISKKELIELIKESQPELVDTIEFKEWIKNKTRG